MKQRDFTSIRLFGCLAALAVSVALGVTGCGPSPASEAGSPRAAGQQPLRVLCTTGQVADMVRNVGGEHVQVEALMGPGVDPHLYRATLGDTTKLERADIVFYNGLHLEGRLAEVLANLARRKPAFAVTEDLVARWPERLRASAAFEGHYDPHVWFDVALWRLCVDTVARRLSEVDPAHAQAYQRHAAAYAERLEALDRWCAERLAEIPEAQRVLVTAHDAFGYFGRAYHVEVHGLQGISTVDEADLAGIRDLVELLVSRRIKAVFVESSVPPKNVQSLIEGCAARGHMVREGGELYSDALGPADSSAATYEGMVRTNVETIVAALR